MQEGGGGMDGERQEHESVAFWQKSQQVFYEKFMPSGQLMPKLFILKLKQKSRVGRDRDCSSYSAQGQRTNT